MYSFSILLKSLGILSYCDKLQYNVEGSWGYLGNDSNPYLYLADSVEYSWEIEELNVNENCKILGSFVGADCPKLSKVTIPASVRSIGDYFLQCTSGETVLTKVVIPSTVAYVGSRAFKGFESLTVYCEAEAKPEAWDEKWNEKDYDGNVVPVVWGYKGE